MGTGYTRNDTVNNIADGNVINASDLDGEFDAIQAAFNGSTGHSHDGTTGEGPQIDTAGIANDAVTLGTKTSGNYVAAGAVSGVGLSGSASSEGATFTVTSNATDANTASTIVARDASGNFSAGQITGTSFVTSGDMTFGDNDKAIFGAGSDLQIYHSGSHSFIQDSGTGNLNILAQNLYLSKADNTEYMISAVNDGAVDLYYDGVSKISTTATGVDVTGELKLNGSTALSYSGGITKLSGAGTWIDIGDANESTVRILADGSGGSILTATATGVDVTGTVTADGLTVDTNTLHVDSTNNRLGIGTTSPNNQLEIKSDTATVVARLACNTGSGRDYGVASNTTGDFGVYDYDASDYRFIINSSGNVGIGTNSPNTNLVVLKNGSLATHPGVPNFIASFQNTDNTTEDAIVGITSSTSGSAKIHFGDTGNVNVGVIDYDNSDNSMRFSTSAAEAARIDSSGRVLVGKTASDIATDGIELGTRIEATADGTYPLRLNRRNSDGTITEFRKDGTRVGQINTVNSDMIIGSNDVGLYFDSVNDQIRPATATGNTVRGSAIDLGRAGGGFKDLYLSGGVKNTASGGTLTFFSDGANERMRIDGASFFIGKTSASLATTGIQATSSGQALSVTRDGGGAFNINRLTSDGELMGLYQGTTQYGLFGVYAGKPFFQTTTGENSTGILCQADAIIPCHNNGAAGGNPRADAATDLGSSSYRFRDLAISRGIYAGSGKGTSGQVLTSDGTNATWQDAAGFTSGTLMLFQQTSAPTGWTKQTTHNDKALRVVSGTAGSGGSSAFTTAFGTPSVSGSVSLSGNISSTTLSTSQIPSHFHFARVSGNPAVADRAYTSIYPAREGTSNVNERTGNTGGGGSHNHGHNLSGSLSSSTASINVQYVDLIIASKD